MSVLGFMSILTVMGIQAGTAILFVARNLNIALLLWFYHVLSPRTLLR